MFGIVIACGFGAIGAFAYMCYKMKLEQKAEGACPIDHSARQEMIEIGKKQKK